MIPIFFAVDEAFVKFMMVTMQSVMDNASRDYEYHFYVLNTGIGDEGQRRVQDMMREGFETTFVDVTPYMEGMKDKLSLRDYYTMTTYYRLCIPDMFPEYDKVVYLDSDVVVLGDISRFYRYDLDGFYVGAVNDQLVQQMDVFGRYVEQVLGIDRGEYFNAGVLLMNTKALREADFPGLFSRLASQYTFVVAQDQDYLNVICKGRVRWIPVAWNVEAPSEVTLPENEIMLVHYNMTAKPWRYEDCTLGGYFWKYAKRVSCHDEICEVSRQLTQEEKEIDAEVSSQLFEICEHEIVKEDNYMKRRGTEKSQARLDILDKIAQYEREGRFDEDVEEDPPGRELKPDEVNYLPRRPYSKLKRQLSYVIARRFMNHMIAERQLIIKEIKGLENFDGLDSGAVITCNHFNAMDSFAMQIAYEASVHGKRWNHELSGNLLHKRRKFYRVIKEGNYTSFPGFYGVLMRNCNTLPLSSNAHTMKKFFEAVDKVLKDGHFVLIYPEQSMWWNYRKPKPLKRGAYTLAAQNMVPVLPVFITMEDSDVLDADGFFVQEYTINIGKPIYPESSLSARKNSTMMMDENARVWKEIYEDSYGIPLEYEGA
jgi:lipopolysaccharide biosynthesis glycosyltransferase/1-acyl-sn-glycerol-3-phosphate acyltransferase